MTRRRTPAPAPALAEPPPHRAPDRSQKTATAGTAIALAGVLGFTACLLARYTAALPRWDLLAMLTLAALGLGLRAFALRRPIPQPVVRPAAPQRAPGFRVEQGDWWPIRKGRATVALFWLLCVPVVVLAGSAAQITSEHQRIWTADDSTIAEVTVTRVSETAVARKRDNLHITANTRPDGTGRSLEWTVPWASRVEGRGWHEGDTVWAMYDAHQASSSRSSPTEAIIALTRQDLERQAGSWTATPEPLLLALMPAGVFAVYWWRLRTGRSEQPGRESVSAAVHNGRARALRVRVTGTRTATLNKGNVLVLTSRQGERELLLGRWVDPDHLASTLDGHEGWLYWSPTAENSLRLTSSHPRSPGSRTRASDRAPLSPAALVLADNRYLRGRTPTAPDSAMPSGDQLARIPAAQCPQARPVDGRTLRTPRLRPLALLAALPGMATLLAMLTLPFADLTRPWAYVLCALSLGVLLPCLAYIRLANRPRARQ